MKRKRVPLEIKMDRTKSWIEQNHGYKQNQQATLKQLFLNVKNYHALTTLRCSGDRK